MDTLKFCKVRDVKAPGKAHPEDAGFDFFIPNDFAPCHLAPGEDVLIPSGVKVIVPEGYALIAMNKSGVATKQKLRVGAAVVDAGYRGEVHIHLFNDGPSDSEVELTPGMKIVQFVLVQIGTHQAEEISVDDYAGYDSERGEGGFGSTGV